jgi:hypothetical protein
MRHPNDDPSTNEFLLTLVGVEAVSIGLVVLVTMFLILRSVLG